MSTAACLSVENVTVSYGAKTALRNINLELASNQVVGVIGPNGAGKSTLLKAVMGLLPLDAGTIRIYGKVIGERRERIAYVPQKESVDWNFPVSVLDVVMMGRYGRLGWLRFPQRSDRDRAMEALAQMEMADSAHVHIRNLSGGQQQRVFIARALAQGADLLLLDEPFVGVDAATEMAIFALMNVLKAKDCTLVVVNHDLSVVERFDSLIMINQRLVAYGPTKEVFQEANLHQTYGGRLTLLQQAEQLGR